MEIAEAQSEMRFAFLGGFVGQFVSGVLWLVSAGLATWITTRSAIWFLVVAGMFIFPLTQVGLKLLGRPGRVGADNSLYTLGFQVAVVLPLSLPVVGAAALYRIEWFFPAFMVVLGAHYLPFAFLYGMPMFFVLGTILWGSGLSLALWVQLPFSVGAWFTAAVLFVFAFLGRASALREDESVPTVGAVNE